MSVQLARVLILHACDRNLIDLYKVSLTACDGLYLCLIAGMRYRVSVLMCECLVVRMRYEGWEKWQFEKKSAMSEKSCIFAVGNK